VWCSFSKAVPAGELGVRYREKAMPTYRGSCHCGRVTFEVEAEIKSVTECNCSMCKRKGALYQKAEVEQLRILSGEDALTAYKFNTETATHYFCRSCGIHPFHRPRLAPERWTVNVRCLDDVDLSTLKVRLFDGQNWEAAAAGEEKS
jgi:hypothetical protein